MSFPDPSRNCAPSLIPRQPAESGRAMPALVVFVDQTDGPWLRFLKPGFRHCFAAVRQAEGLWLICDPLKHRIETLAVEPARDLALAEAWLAMGHRVVLGWTRPTAPPRRPPLPAPLTCVAVVKRLLGLWCPAVVTPRQLHRHLLGHADAPWSDLSVRNLYLTKG